MQTKQNKISFLLRLVHTLYLSAGFIFLPFVWAINTIWFFSEAFLKPAYDEQKEIKRCKCDSFVPPIVVSCDALCESVNLLLLIKHSASIPFADVIFSGIGSIIWIVALVTWVLAFQMNRAEWGEFADSISFIIPLGRA